MIYLDHASLTPIDKHVLKVVNKYSTDEYMNPSSIHSAGVSAKKVLDSARDDVAKTLHAHSDEIVFTGSGTEANNLAILGTTRDISNAHIIVSAIEHSSIIEPVRALEKLGVKVDLVPVDKDGVVDLNALKKMIRPTTRLVSVMMTNNELGSIQPIHEIAKIVRDARKSGFVKNIILHTDACQSMLYEDINLEKLGVDMLTLDSHKIYGPRGVGMLFVRRNIRDEIKSVTHGGGQEMGLRSGTENVPGIVGFAEAMKIALVEREKESVRVARLRDFFAEGLKKLGFVINGCGDGNEDGKIPRLSPHILNVSHSDIDGEFFVLQLDARGVYCLTRSACLQDEDESYVLKAIGKSAKNSVRFSLGRSTTLGDIKKVLKMIEKLI